MSILTISTDSDPFYTQRTDLEGTEYVFSFEWSRREQCWYLSLSTAEEVALVHGVKLVCYLPLLKRLADIRAPQGQFMVVSKTNDDSPPGLLDLLPDTGRCELIYFTSDSVGRK